MGSSDSAGGALTKETTAVTLASSAFSSSASWTNCNAGLTASKWHHHANAITPKWNRHMKISNCDSTNNAYEVLRQSSSTRHRSCSCRACPRAWRRHRQCRVCVGCAHQVRRPHCSRTEVKQEIPGTEQTSIDTSHPVAEGQASARRLREPLQCIMDIAAQGSCSLNATARQWSVDATLSACVRR